MLVALGNDQPVRSRILFHHIPGFTGITRFPTNTQPLALAQGIEHQAEMTTQPLTANAVDLTRPGRLIMTQEFSKPPLADKADAGTVFLGMIAQTRRRRQFAYLFLLQIAHRKQDLTEPGLIEGI